MYTVKCRGIGIRYSSKKRKIATYFLQNAWGGASVVAS